MKKRKSRSPRQRKNEREVVIERAVYTFAELLGWLQHKFKSTNKRGIPDRIFIKNSRVIFIEFKAPGEDPTKLQAYEIRRLREQGAEVYVIDDIMDGKTLFLSLQADI